MTKSKQNVDVIKCSMLEHCLPPPLLARSHTNTQFCMQIFDNFAILVTPFYIFKLIKI